MTLARREESTDITHLPLPEQVLEFQTRCANALMGVIEQQKGNKNPFMAMIDGKRFLTFESWQTIARFNGCHVLVESVEPIIEDDQIIAYKAWASVVDGKAGAVRSRAEMECGLTAYPTQGKEGREKHKAAKSAAQTWAGAKACRMAFSFVAVLAGFEATTAEEMQISGDEEVLCPIHGEAFFKRGRMKVHGHKNGDGSWCNFKPALFNDRLRAAAVAVEWDNLRLNDYCKAEYGKTWSGLGPHECISLIGFLEDMLGSVDPQEPMEVAEQLGVEQRPVMPLGS